jgi:hypothetical protein
MPLIFVTAYWLPFTIWSCVLPGMRIRVYKREAASLLLFALLIFGGLYLLH